MTEGWRDRGTEGQTKQTLNASGYAYGMWRHKNVRLVKEFNKKQEAESKALERDVHNQFHIAHFHISWTSICFGKKEKSYVTSFVRQ